LVLLIVNYSPMLRPVYVAPTNYNSYTLMETVTSEMDAVPAETAMVCSASMIPHQSSR
jgi:hypothetical protein